MICLSYQITWDRNKMILYSKRNIQIFSYLINISGWTISFFIMSMCCQPKQIPWEEYWKKSNFPIYPKKIPTIFSDHLFLLEKFNVTFAQPCWHTCDSYMTYNFSLLSFLLFSGIKEKLVYLNRKRLKTNVKQQCWKQFQNKENIG